jgi:hypothetical protein
VDSWAYLENIEEDLGFTPISREKAGRGVGFYYPLRKGPKSTRWEIVTILVQRFKKNKK